MMKLYDKLQEVEDSLERYNLDNGGSTPAAAGEDAVRHLEMERDNITQQLRESGAKLIQMDKGSILSGI